jgi:2-polyprenyl-6-methoxyphenol hydroxylase-like FAD-dependent oxidoreductase
MRRGAGVVGALTGCGLRQKREQIGLIANRERA